MEGLLLQVIILWKVRSWNTLRGLEKRRNRYEQLSQDCAAAGIWWAGRLSSGPVSASTTQSKERRRRDGGSWAAQKHNSRGANCPRLIMPKKVGAEGVSPPASPSPPLKSMLYRLIVNSLLPLLLPPHHSGCALPPIRPLWKEHRVYRASLFLHKGKLLHSWEAHLKAIAGAAPQPGTNDGCECAPSWAPCNHSSLLGVILSWFCSHFKSRARPRLLWDGVGPWEERRKKKGEHWWGKGDFRQEGFRGSEAIAANRGTGSQPNSPGWEETGLVKEGDGGPLESRLLPSRHHRATWAGPP